MNFVKQKTLQLGKVMEKLSDSLTIHHNQCILTSYINELQCTNITEGNIYLQLDGRQLTLHNKYPQYKTP